jgi:hypothetical protein
VTEQRVIAQRRFVDHDPDFATITSFGCALLSFMHGGYVCKIKDSSRVRKTAHNYGWRSAAMMI